MTRHMLQLLASSILLAMPACAQHAAAKPANSPDAALARWREAYAQDLMRPDGWLSLVALEWLRDGDSTVGSAPDNKIKLDHIPAHLGTIHLAAGVISFATAPGVDGKAVLVDGQAVTKATLRTDDSGHPSALSSGNVLMTVIHRGDRDYLRVKDAYSPGRLHFRGLAWYPDTAKYRIRAKWVPYLPAKTLKITNVLGQISDEPSPGYAEFQLDGQTVRLDATLEGKGLFFDFRDVTGRTTTDGTGRFLNTDLPDHGVAAPGTVLIDFNYAHNPPCGYTNYATCPLPPTQNRFTVAIPAGEKRYPGAS